MSERAVERPWRRRQPPRRRACSPTGEHAAVERPGRGAPFCRARRAATPVRPFFSRAGQGPVRVGFFSLPFLIPLFLFDLVLLSSELMWGIGLGLGFVCRPCSFPLPLSDLNLVPLFRTGYRSRVRNPTCHLFCFVFSFFSFAFIRMGN